MFETEDTIIRLRAAVPARAITALEELATIIESREDPMLNAGPIRNILTALQIDTETSTSATLVKWQLYEFFKAAQSAARSLAIMYQALGYSQLPEAVQETVRRLLNTPIDGIANAGFDELMASHTKLEEKVAKLENGIENAVESYESITEDLRGLHPRRRR